LNHMTTLAPEPVIETIWPYEKGISSGRPMAASPSISL
jgi:hypothetical protein